MLHVEMLFRVLRTSLVFLVKMLFPFVRNFCGALCQNVVSHCKKLVLLLVKVLFLKSINNFFVYFTFPFYDRNSVIGIATCYGLDGLGSNLSREEIFRASPDRPKAHPAS